MSATFLAASAWGLACVASRQHPKEEKVDEARMRVVGRFAILLDSLCWHFGPVIILQNSYRWRIRMEAVKISPKFQVVIPKKLREALKLSPGQKVQMVVYGNRIEMIPLRKLSEMKGFLKGIDTAVEREPDRV